MYHVTLSSLPAPALPASAAATAPPKVAAPSSSTHAEGEPAVVRTEYGRVHLCRRFFDEPTVVVSAASSSAVHVLLLSVPPSVGLTRLLAAFCPAEAPVSALRSCLRVCDPHTGQHSALLEWPDSAAASLFAQRIDGRPLPSTLFSCSAADDSHTEPLVTQAVGDSERSHTSSAAGVDRCLAFLLSERPVWVADSGCVLERPGYAELPRCPRCLLRLDTSCSGIVAPFGLPQPLSMQLGHREQRQAVDEPGRPEGQQCDGALVSAPGSAVTAGWWSDLNCGVCDSLESALSLPSSVQCGECSVVGSEREAIWLCLVCGHTGCGRNLSGHAAVHFERTGHRYCIELLQRYVWDYHADGFVHRVHGRDNAAAGVSNQPTTSASGSGGGSSQRQQHAHQREAEYASTGSRFAQGEYDSDAELEEPEESDDWLHTDEQREGQSHSPSVDGGDEGEDDGLLHGKLASITSHYSHLLSSELSKQADFFEQLIADKRYLVDGTEAQHDSQMAAMQRSVVSLHAELDAVQSALRQCRAQLGDRRRRNGAQHDENSFVKQINASLINDQQQQQQQRSAQHQPAVQQHSGDQHRASKSGAGSGAANSPRVHTALVSKQRRIAQLQADIASIMQQLDAGSSGNNKHGRGSGAAG